MYRVILVFREQIIHEVKPDLEKNRVLCNRFSYCLSYSEEVQTPPF